MKFDDLKIVTITPDRGDRPELINHMIYLLGRQTVRPNQVIIIDHKPKSDLCDITERYRIGYSSVTNADVILFIENDDWYAENYIETMILEWTKAGKPDIFGINTTYYYHVGMQSYFKMIHTRRSCAMSTLIKPNLNISWPADNEPFTDVYLWNNVKNSKLFKPTIPICLGIKHGIGKTGGGMHTSQLHRYQQNDFDYKFLNAVIKSDPISLEFYKSLKNKSVGRG